MALSWHRQEGIGAVGTGLGGGALVNFWVSGEKLLRQPWVLLRLRTVEG
jgi:hypothetical protein